MSDIKTIWNSDFETGDWGFNPTTVARQPILVTSPTPFAVCDGNVSSFPLVSAPGVIDTVVASIYRNDWQGNQLLYPTPRTNRCPYSDAFNQSSAWALNSASVTTSATLAPDGVSRACELVEGTGTGQHWMFWTVSTPIGQVSAGSIYVKAGARSAGRMLVYDGNSTFFGVWFDLSAQTVSATRSNGTVLTSSITAVDGGWFRLSFGGNYTNSSTVQGIYFNLANSPGNVSYTGDGVSGIYVWHAQLEPGSTATPTIPTNGAPVTVTDYTLSPNGLLTLATAPAAGAVLTWTGSYVLSTVSPGGDLQSGSDIQTALLISLFTDRLAGTDDKIPDGTGDPRGWCCDDPSSPIGSRLWLLQRAKQTTETANRARDYIVEALQWLIDDGVVAKFDIRTQWVGPGKLGAWVVAYRMDGSTVAQQFGWAWKGMN
ncbi:phage head spike fiber domain-containing protein [Aquitalea magnusonii]|uniref:Phage gp46-like protein n=1 Tax=Aquitalea magnusonii TaxID=332411 RepID=A0A318JMZ9_9NEIS|nr:phage GP46 family protein [Aquitalea magnusonii]PXX49365.1 phage gp46-like protein [Aquitalea magnusonii]